MRGKLQRVPQDFMLKVEIVKDNFGLKNNVEAFRVLGKAIELKPPQINLKFLGKIPKRTKNKKNKYVIEV